MSLLNFFPQSQELATDNSPAVSRATCEPARPDPWEGLRSRISRYRFSTRQFLLWNEEAGDDMRFLHARLYMSGAVLHSKKNPEKTTARVFRYFFLKELDEVLPDAVDFDREDEAIKFMQAETDDMNFRGEKSLCQMGRYVYEVVDGRPGRRWIGTIDGEDHFLD
jgi:hypothetical protein